MQISSRLRKLILVFLGFLIMLFGKLVEGGVSRQARVVDPSRRANRRFANRLALSGASFRRKLASVLLQDRGELTSPCGFFFFTLLHHIHKKKV